MLKYVSEIIYCSKLNKQPNILFMKIDCTIHFANGTSNDNKRECIWTKRGEGGVKHSTLVHIDE